jgi:hypothetical protein
MSCRFVPAGHIGIFESTHGATTDSAMQKGPAVSGA